MGLRFKYRSGDYITSDRYPQNDSYLIGETKEGEQVRCIYWKYTHKTGYQQYFYWAAADSGVVVFALDKYHVWGRDIPLDVCPALVDLVLRGRV